MINKKKKKKFTLNTKNWGINIDKNEYSEIILSNSNHTVNINGGLNSMIMN